MIEVRQMRDKMDQMIRRMTKLEQRIESLESGLELQPDTTSYIDKVMTWGKKIGLRKTS